MALKDVKDAREKFQNYSGLVETLEKDPSKKEPVAGFILNERTAPAMDRNGAEYAALDLAARVRDYNDVRADMINLQRNARGTYLTEIGNNYEQVLAKVKTEDLKGVAYLAPKIEHSDKVLEDKAKIAEKSKTMIEEAKKQSYGTYMKDLKERSEYGFDVLLRLSATNPNYAKTPALARSQELAKEFGEGLTREQTEKYVANVAGSGDEAKEFVYEQLGARLPD